MIKAGYPAHEFDWFSASQVCRYCGVSLESIEDGLASPNCDIAKQVPWSRIAPPVALGTLIIIVLIVGMFL